MLFQINSILLKMLTDNVLYILYIIRFNWATAWGKKKKKTAEVFKNVTQKCDLMTQGYLWLIV